MMPGKDFILKIAKKIKRKIKDDLFFILDIDLTEEDISLDKEFSSESSEAPPQEAEEDKEVPVQSDPDKNRTISAEQLAMIFHTNYEKLAPGHGYETKKESAVPWKDVPENNRLLMIDTCEQVLQQLFDINIDFDKEYPEDSVINLKPVKDFFELYIGATIVGYDVYSEDTEDFEESISGKIIAGTAIRDGYLHVQLNSINGSQRGEIRLEPSTSGEFAERWIDDEPMWASRYRLKLYGGTVIEYLDSDEEGQILFIDNQRES